jgi:hypothetical protein
MTMNRYVLRCALPALALLASGCGEQRPVPPLDLGQLNAVAAEYRTTIEAAKDGKSATEWRFWRASDRIERENPKAQSGDLWVRDGTTMFHTRLYHAERRGIEYRSEDLKILGDDPDWTALATLLDPRLLASLHERANGWRDDFPYRRYGGEVGGVHWDITVRTDHMLPVRIERRGPERGVEIVELLHAFDAGKSPWQPPVTTDYVVLDYADLGDNERDPFVMRLQAQESGGHLHGHAH